MTSTMDTGAGEAARHAREFHIVVDGTAKSVTTDELSFDQVVRLAFDPVPTGAVTFTVSYRHADQHPAAGTLHAGQSVRIKDGTVFSVTATTKS